VHCVCVKGVIVPRPERVIRQANPLLFMHRRLFVSWLGVVGLVGAGTLEAKDAEPTAEEIMRLVRMSYALQDYKLTGSLRDDATGRKEAFELTMQQQTIRFRFANPAEIVDLDLAKQPAALSRVVAGGKEVVGLASYAESVRGMAMNYEDLSLRFTYWPQPKLMGTDTIKTAKCWVVRVVNPDGKGPYGTVDLWVHQGSGGVARMDAYDPLGKLMKRFQVVSVQKVRDVTILKEMRVEAFDPPGSGKARRTYMKLDKN
jgi:hypothetical protein